MDYVFAALLALLLKSVPTDEVYVDLEYPKSTKIIESLVKPVSEITIHWTLVGKNSPAHDIAYKIYVGKETRLGRVVSIEEV